MFKVTLQDICMIFQTNIDTIEQIYMYAQLYMNTASMEGYYKGVRYDYF